MSIEYLTVTVDPEKDTHIIDQTDNGKLPVLLLEDGVTYLNEPLSIARVFSNNKFNFYGPDAI